jgi:transposase-like protein
MATVFITTQTILDRRLNKLTRTLDWTQWKTLGFLTALWFNSQEEQQVQASEMEIIRWIEHGNPEEESRFFNGLLVAEYITKTGEDKYRIHGNERAMKESKRLAVHIRKVRAKAGARGGLATGPAKQEAAALREKKKKAWAAVNAAVASGLLIKPDCCEICTSTAPLDGHHEDYEKPLVVHWLCASCHRNEHTNKNNKIRGVVRSKHTSSTIRQKQMNNFSVEPQLMGDDVVEFLVGSVKPDTQRAWLQAYKNCGPEWIKEEVLKAHAWQTANPRKASKDFGRFMTNWLGRSFESWRKGVPTRRQTQSELNTQVAMDLFKKNQEGSL